MSFFLDGHLGAANDAAELVVPWIERRQAFCGEFVSESQHFGRADVMMSGSAKKAWGGRQAVARWVAPLR